jgi:uncharacterized Zn-binding protein involved in type VI secretion
MDQELKMIKYLILRIMQHICCHTPAASVFRLRTKNKTNKTDKTMPFAARVSDMHLCPMITGTVPHVGGPVLPAGCPTVLIGGLPAARVGDMCTCTGPPDTIAAGSGTVMIGGSPAARMGDSTAHGGVIIIGCPTVNIGG